MLQIVTALGCFVCLFVCLSFFGMMLYLVILVVAFVDHSRGKCYRLLQLLFVLFVCLFVCLFGFLFGMMLYLVLLVAAFVRLGKYYNVQLQ